MTDAFRDDLAALIKHVAAPATVVGASRGGYSALALAGTDGAAARLVEALVLVDITARAPTQTSTPLLDFMRSRPHGFATLDDAADAVTAFMPHRRRLQNPSGLRKNLRERGGRLFWHWDLEVATAEHRAWPDRLENDARRVRVPTLLVCGELSNW